MNDFSDNCAIEADNYLGHCLEKIEQADALKDVSFANTAYWHYFAQACLYLALAWFYDWRRR